MCKKLFSQLPCNQCHARGLDFALLSMHQSRPMFQCHLINADAHGRVTSLSVGILIYIRASGYVYPLWEDIANCKCSHATWLRSLALSDSPVLQWIVVVTHWVPWCEECNHCYCLPSWTTHPPTINARMQVGNKKGEMQSLSHTYFYRSSPSNCSLSDPCFH